MMKVACIAVVLFANTCTGFVVSTAKRTPTLLKSDGGDGNDKEEGLILDGLGDQMGKMQSKYGFTESDFLAAARKRSEERTASLESGAKDEEWKKLAEEKKNLFGEMDDWESSKKEAGNADSQILMFTEAPADEEGGDDDDEPKLLLL